MRLPQKIRSPLRVPGVGTTPVPCICVFNHSFHHPSDLKGLAWWMLSGHRCSVLSLDNARRGSHNEKGGNWADYAMVPARALLAVPEELPDEQAASFTNNP